VKKDVNVEFRVALDAQHVISIPKHLNSSLFRPTNYLCFSRQIYNLIKYNHLILPSWFRNLYSIHNLEINTSSRWHLKSESFDGKLRDDDCNKLIVETPMSQPAPERTTFPPNARPIIYNTVKYFKEACATCNTLLANKYVSLNKHILVHVMSLTISLYVRQHDERVLLFFWSNSLVARFTHIMCGEVGNPMFEPQSLHKLSLIATNWAMTHKRHL
jgi:hypothetical protein